MINNVWMVLTVFGVEFGKSFYAYIIDRPAERRGADCLSVYAALSSCAPLGSRFALSTSTNLGPAY
jgi:hypothetical protein